MVEIPSIKDSTFEEKISWRDIQGLSWLLADEEIDSKVSTYACA